MFIPQAKPNCPLRSGLSSTVVFAKAGRAWLTAKSGNTTREVQSPLSWRSVEHNTERHLLPDSDQVGRIAALDRDMHFLDLAHERGLPGLLGTEEEPGEEPAEGGTSNDDDEVGCTHARE